MTTKAYKTHLRRLGMRWERLLNGIESARVSMLFAYGERHLLTPEARDELIDLHQRLIGLVQRAWEDEARDT